MMTTVVLSTYKTANFLEGGGHFWVYMQYVQALRRLGCDVYWLEHLRSNEDEGQDAAILSAFAARLAQFGLKGKLVLYKNRHQPDTGHGAPGYVGITPSEAEAIFRRADLLLNFHYAIDPGLLSRFHRSALVDIDPGLFQFWLSRGQLSVPKHHCYFTTGETVGTPAALFSDCGLPWLHIRPPVCLDLWPYAYDPHCEAFTTVSNWRGKDWLAEGDRLIENTKGIAFLQFAELPLLTPQALELALGLGAGDAEDRRHMERLGWRICHAYEVAGTPEKYQSYVQRSRGEFSCAKPSCLMFQNAWVSDRTVCYLASGKPVVVQNTGPSSFLPSGEGMFRFSTLQAAVDALATINQDYERHCRAAREIAEEFFDGKQILQQVLDLALE